MIAGRPEAAAVDPAPASGLACGHQVSWAQDWSIKQIRGIFSSFFHNKYINVFFKCLGDLAHNVRRIDCYLAKHQCCVQLWSSLLFCLAVILLYHDDVLSDTLICR